MQGLARTREKAPAQEQWVSMARTIGINGKTMRRTIPRTMETMKNAGECLRAVMTPIAVAAICALEKQNATEAVGSRRANVTLHLLPCATRVGNANAIQSIPAIQVFADIAFEKGWIMAAM
jgi:hypothetical protein